MNNDPHADAAWHSSSFDIIRFVPSHSIEIRIIDLTVQSDLCPVSLHSSVISRNFSHQSGCRHHQFTIHRDHGSLISDEDVNQPTASSCRPRLRYSEKLAGWQLAPSRGSRWTNATDVCTLSSRSSPHCHRPPTGTARFRRPSRVYSEYQYTMNSFHRLLICTRLHILVYY